MEAMKFYGRVNDQEFNNVNDYNKAIMRVMNDGDLKSATSRTWIEKVEDTPEEQVEVKKNVTQQEPVNSGLQEIFAKFAKKFLENESDFESLKKDIVNHFNCVDDSLIESDLEILDKELHSLNKTLRDAQNNNSNNEIELANARKALEANTTKLKELQSIVDKQTANVEKLQVSYDKECQGLKMWSDLYDFMFEISQEVGYWIDEHLKEDQPKEVCEKCGKPLNDCKCNKDEDCKCDKDLKKPSWMSNSHFNFLKAILS
jgi:hypothetical protein